MSAVKYVLLSGEIEVLPHALAVQELGAFVFVVVVGLLSVLASFESCSLFVIHRECLLEPAERALLLFEGLAAYRTRTTNGRRALPDSALIWILRRSNTVKRSHAA